MDKLYRGFESHFFCFLQISKIIMFFYLKVSCKDKRILKKFTTVLTKIKSLSIFLKSFPTYEKRKFVTVLKSPHVNKTAQEQFEYRYYCKRFLIWSVKPLIFFSLLKKLKNLSFLGINLEVKGLFERNKTNKHSLKMISPDNIILTDIPKMYVSHKFKVNKQAGITQTNSNNSRNSLLLKKYIQLFDLYGEILLRDVFYFSFSMHL
jgi:ribosomal protein S10